MSGEVLIAVAGQTLWLHPERAVVWVERKTVIVADTHFGKSAVFRRHGIAVPMGADEHDRARLNRVIWAAGAERLIVLGDFLHSPLDAYSAEARDLEEWSEQLRPTLLEVVAGNHDRGTRQRWIPPFDWHEGERLEAPFRFTHDADTSRACALGLFTLSGHVHPVVRLQGAGRPGPRVPVFWQHAGGLVLPSFGSFTGGYVVDPAPHDRLFAVAPERVVPFPAPARRTHR